MSYRDICITHTVEECSKKQRGGMTGRAMWGRNEGGEREFIEGVDEKRGSRVVLYLYRSIERIQLIPWKF